MVQFWAGLPPEKNPQEIFIMGAGASTADADWGLRPIFQTAPTNENNYGYYSNAEFDRVIEAAMRETDAAKRQALYTRAQEIVYLEDPGAVWLFDTLYSVAARKAVTGLRPMAARRRDLRTRARSAAPEPRDAGRLARLVGAGACCGSCPCCWRSRCWCSRSST